MNAPRQTTSEALEAIVAQTPGLTTRALSAAVDKSSATTERLLYGLQAAGVVHQKARDAMGAWGWFPVE